MLYTTNLLANICEQNKNSSKLIVSDKFLQLHTSHEIALNSNIKTAIISLHGTLRNGEEYFTDMCNAVKEKIESTLVVSPSFKRSDDQKEEDEFFWGRRWYQKWKYGYIAQNDDHLGSFDLMDQLIKKIANKETFPNLKRVILIGHSAGGQFVQRYATATKIRDEITPELRLVVSNPSSYFYLTNKRTKFINNDFNEFTPDKTECPDYDEYIYGTESGLPPYISKYSIEELKQNFKQNPVIYLMSEQDKSTDDLDQSCGANLQGENRINRAYNFFQHIRNNYKDHLHNFMSISNIGHEHVDVFNSQEAKRIFNESLIDHELITNHVGPIIDINSEPIQNFILMGGGDNEAESFKLLLKSANGGDVVVLSTKNKINHRYTHYLWRLAEENKINVHSITTLSIKNRSATAREEAKKILLGAEAIFLTGGDQFRYKSYWEDTEFINILNNKIKQGTPLAGSSAGLAILGQFYFSAENGTVYSEDALENPRSSKITIENDLLSIPLLKNVITDSHYSERNREGRLLSFQNKVIQKYDIFPIGIGVDEKTSLIINKNEIYKLGPNNVFVYRPLGFKGLSHGPVKRFRLEHNKKYAAITELGNKFDLIEVINGEIIEK